MRTGFAREKPRVQVPGTIDKAVTDSYSSATGQAVPHGPGRPAKRRFLPTRARIPKTEAISRSAQPSPGLPGSGAAGGP